ncbi:Crp/Fnr family transcriptional regulator [Cellvibrio sp. PSBB023]|uniref:Crp/Fnr family transcriptional regulator n=1 Tax=Cellvibrio sp. PSBB023 TaxID=1945512 RepID=UPI00098F60FC|nr:cyclic nucleotide-binding domain-containing protein [Cellvibrio sp. PSBB023]AQT61621.1 calcium-binding protein [Cellvibrio sp. PSBB023]
MYLSTKQSELMSELAAKLSALTELICAPVAPAEETFQVAASDDIFADIPPTRLLRIVEGQVDYSLHGKLVMHFEAGDLLGLPRSLNLPQGQFSCSGPTSLVAYERDSLVEYASHDLKYQRNWTYFLVCSISYFEQALTQELRGEFQPAAGFLHFRAGETIIQQGDTADRVYTLLEGAADAVCDGVTVGQIHPNEIFGALAVFTRQPRMASVIARSDCTLLAVRKEEFIALIEHQPHICLGLIEEMAAKINQLNGQLLQLKSGGT